MARQSERDRGVSYPQLDRAQLDAVIAALVFTARTRMPDADTPAMEHTMAYLIAFYTRRWGLPAVLRSSVRGG